MVPGEFLSSPNADSELQQDPSPAGMVAPHVFEPSRRNSFCSTGATFDELSQLMVGFQLALGDVLLW